MDNTTSPQNDAPPVDFFDLVTNIPVGLCKILLDEGYTLLYGNPYVFDLFGYTPEQFSLELQNRIIRTFYAEDYTIVTETIHARFLEGQSDFHIEHRLSRRDGTVLWTLVSGSYTLHEGAVAAHCMVVDITSRKQMEERLRIDEERFRLTLAQTESTFFDYDIESKVMIHADKSAKRFGLAHETHNVPESLLEQELVHPDSAATFLEAYRDIRSGAPTVSCLIQAKTVTGRYAWQRLTMTNIFNREGKPARAVGMLEDIDEQVRREESLRETSLRDALTGLYHKGETERRIRKLLSQEDPAGVLFMLDIDNFKNVNDHYGHMFGDTVLREAAERIETLCRRDDVVGRIGGDEFLLYLDGISTEGTAKRKAAQFCAAFDDAFTQGDTHAQIHCTVGFSLCPPDGVHFEELYQTADIALYDAKRRGKNTFSHYEPSMGEQLWGAPFTATSCMRPILEPEAP